MSAVWLAIAAAALVLIVIVLVRGRSRGPARQAGLGDAVLADVEKLSRRGDYAAAAELMMGLGQVRQAMELFERARAWERASRAAERIKEYRRAGQLSERSGEQRRAADLYRQAEDFIDSARIYEQLGLYLLAAETLEQQRDPEYLRLARLWENAFVDTVPSQGVALRKAEYEMLQHTANHTAKAYEEAGELERATHFYEIGGRFDVAAKLRRQLPPRAMGELDLARDRLFERLQASIEAAQDWSGSFPRLKVTAESTAGEAVSGPAGESGVELGGAAAQMDPVLRSGAFAARPVSAARIPAPTPATSDGTSSSGTYRALRQPTTSKPAVPSEAPRPEVPAGFRGARPATLPKAGVPPADRAEPAAGGFGSRPASLPKVAAPALDTARDATISSGMFRAQTGGRPAAPTGAQRAAQPRPAAKPDAASARPDAASGVVTTGSPRAIRPEAPQAQPPAVGGQRPVRADAPATAAATPKAARGATGSSGTYRASQPSPSSAAPKPAAPAPAVPAASRRSPSSQIAPPASPPTPATPPAIAVQSPPATGPQRVVRIEPTTLPGAPSAVMPEAAAAALPLPAVDHSSERVPVPDPTTRRVTEVRRAVGRFRILSLIGEGGLGVVFRAADAETQRDVALKFLPADIATSPRLLDIFDDLARSLATLQHPHIIKIVGHGVLDKRAYVATELVTGTTAADQLRLHPEGLSVLDALHLADGLLSALSYAHAQNVLHLDIRPANLFQTLEGFVKVGDFSLPLLADPGRTTQISAPPPHMSPEQALGRQLGPAADLYSVGATIYELLTGRPPFEAKVRLPGTPVPSARAASAAVPKRLDELIKHCLAEEPDKRPASADVALQVIRTMRRRVASFLGEHAPPDDDSAFDREAVQGLAHEISLPPEVRSILMDYLKER